jgi:hypothetical protein
MLATEDATGSSPKGGRRGWSGPLRVGCRATAGATGPGLRRQGRAGRGRCCHAASPSGGRRAGSSVSRASGAARGDRRLSRTGPRRRRRRPVHRWCGCRRATRRRRPARRASPRSSPVQGGLPGLPDPASRAGRRPGGRSPRGRAGDRTPPPPRGGAGAATRQLDPRPRACRAPAPAQGPTRRSGRRPAPARGRGSRWR